MRSSTVTIGWINAHSIPKKEPANLMPKSFLASSMMSLLLLIHSLIICILYKKNINTIRLPLNIVECIIVLELFGTQRT